MRLNKFEKFTNQSPFAFSTLYELKGSAYLHKCGSDDGNCGAWWWWWLLSGMMCHYVQRLFIDFDDLKVEWPQTWSDKFDSVIITVLQGTMYSHGARKSKQRFKILHRCNVWWTRRVKRKGETAENSLSDRCVSVARKLGEKGFFLH